MIERAILQTHVYSWVMGRTITRVRHVRHSRHIVFELAGNVTLMVQLAGDHCAVYTEPVLDMRAIMGLNFHERAGTFTLLLSDIKTAARALRNIESPVCSLTMWVATAQTQPVRVLNAQGNNVTLQFGTFHAERAQAAEEPQFTWTPNPDVPGGFFVGMKREKKV